MKVCHVLYPGAFKPVHAGHIGLMQKYLDSTEYKVKLTVIISKGEREGITAETSKWFLDNVFHDNPNVNIIIAPDPSPIKTVYDMIGTKALGDGIYAMGASSKGTDIKRAEDIVTKFAEGGKYYTPGVEVIFFPINPVPIVYSNRIDDYNDIAISSTIVRNDIRKHDYRMFRIAYLPILKKYNISEDTLKKYYNMLSEEVLPLKEHLCESTLCENLNNSFNAELLLNEGGAAGHMSHPYDYTDFTFKDLKNLIHDLFAGTITDVTEKLDGQNLFASVDEHGNTIFARNETTLKEQPWYLEDVMNNPKWIGTPSVQHAFTNAALTVDKIFKNIPQSISFFNYDNKAEKIRYRYWVNLEIIDTENFNVIPYADSKVSFHNFVGIGFDYSNIDNKDNFTKFPVLDQVNRTKLEILQKAIDKTTKTEFKAQLTPEVIFKKLSDGEVKAQKYYDAIDRIINTTEISEDTTIKEYKVKRITDYVTNSKQLYWLSGDVLDAMIDRWIDDKKNPNIKTIGNTYTLETGELMSKEQYNELRLFDKEYLKDALKIIMKPIDTLFIKVGNEIIKRMDGFSNQGHEKEVQSILNKTLKEIKDAVENSEDEKAKSKLEKNLARLAEVDSELASTEGIVIKWHGRLMKITGSFAPLNQILGCGFKSMIKNKEEN